MVQQGTLQLFLYCSFRAVNWCNWWKRQENAREEGNKVGEDCREKENDGV